MTLPIIDTHCDLLVYLTEAPKPDPNNVADIGCALPALAQGNVKLQVMAIYTATETGSTRYAALQSEMFKKLSENEPSLTAVSDVAGLHQALQQENGTAMVAAIENASGFCEENEPLEDGFKRLEKIIDTCGRLLYIGFTHHAANRFGGGNSSTTGLTTDGKMLLDYLHGRHIAIDLAHTSDAMAHDILTHIDAERLALPVIASHSNFRQVWAHNRNLPDELVQEIVHRQGLIGINFLRAFLHDSDPDALLHHLTYGLAQGAQDCLCFGADYFYTHDNKDVTRIPFYFKEHEQAGTSYTYILNQLQQQLPEAQLQKLAYKNVQHFIERIWS